MDLACFCNNVFILFCRVDFYNFFSWLFLFFQEVKVSDFAESFIFYFLFVVPFIVNYLIFKVFKTFKFLDKKIKNTFLEILFLILISALCLFLLFREIYNFKNIHDVIYALYFSFLPILSYFANITKNI